MLEAYVPGKKFPSISVTGTACALNCDHCNRHYLKGMIPAETPEKLIEVLERISEDGANGFLLSGGAREDGSVPIEAFADLIRKVKIYSNLMVNVHVGLIRDSTLAALKKMNADMVSLDAVGADETVKEVYHLDKKAEEYLNALKRLDDAHIKHSPHITIGLHYGKILGEYRAVDAVKDSRAVKMVINVLIPTKGTPMESINPPSIADIKKIMDYTEGFHGERVLGCMRPRKGEYPEIERYAIESGFSGIVLPTEDTRKWAEKEGYEWETKERCCVL